MRVSADHLHRQQILIHSLRPTRRERATTDFYIRTAREYSLAFCMSYTTHRLRDNRDLWALFSGYRRDFQWEV